MTSILHYEQDELGVVTLTLNHPGTRNALTGTGLVEALLDACQLSAPHEAYLLGCGLTQPAPASYATLNGNRDAVAAHLQRTFSGDVL